MNYQQKYQNKYNYNYWRCDPSFKVVNCESDVWFEACGCSQVAPKRHSNHQENTFIIHCIDLLIFGILELTFYLVLHGLLSSANSKLKKLQAIQPCNSFFCLPPKRFLLSPTGCPIYSFLGRSTHWLCVVQDS